MRYITLIVKVILLTFLVGQESQASVNVAPNADKEVVCFVYHRFGDTRYPSTNISLRDFEAHLDYLIKNKVQVLTLSDAIQYLQSNSPARKTVVITIDDGYKSFFTNGLPLLKKYGLPATLFVNTETVGGMDYMNWEELRMVTEESVEIGNHTATHAYFLNQPESSRYTSFAREIVLSQSLFSKYLNQTPNVFSYPYGELDQQMEEEVRRAGFTSAVAQNSGVIHEGTNFFQCPRFPMSESYAALDKFIEKASMHALKLNSESPANFAQTDSERPELTLTMNRTNLRLEDLQCFVQGGSCAYKIVKNGDDSFSILVQSTGSISGRRRTLYTVTVPDREGKWHWHSHLWINTKVH